MFLSFIYKWWLRGRRDLRVLLRLCLFLRLHLSLDVYVNKLLLTWVEFDHKLLLEYFVVPPCESIQQWVYLDEQEHAALPHISIGMVDNLSVYVALLQDRFNYLLIRLCLPNLHVYSLGRGLDSSSYGLEKGLETRGLLHCQEGCQRFGEEL
jgi:hypothetical protein